MQFCYRQKRLQYKGTKTELERHLESLLRRAEEKQALDKYVGAKNIGKCRSEALKAKYPVKGYN